ncbi:MAG TPA: hypothetical protein VLZ54_03140, partial [Arenibacter sp.]|nr:hypothetical protein [Arenibacter sp.]
LFGIFILLINPKFSRKVYITEKTNLIVLADNSTSIQEADKAWIEADRAALKNRGPEFDERFQIAEYIFGSSLRNGDSLTLMDKSTNISKALSGLNEIYTKTNTAIVLFTDGNQTLGEDYEHYGKRQEFPIFPIVLGDTTIYDDIRIGQVNSNKYAFLNSKFPLEVFVSYEGKDEIGADLQIFVNDKLTYREKLSLSPHKNTKTINAQILAHTVGIKNIRVSVSQLPNEKNILNNEKRVSLEVLDEGTRVALISNIAHPDVGTLKKIIESNGQRSVGIYKSTVDLEKLENSDLYLLYQPDASFARIYGQISLRKANSFTIGGTHTDWKFLEKIQNGYHFESGYPIQEIFAVPDLTFSKFDISDFSFEGFPPLDTDVGAAHLAGSYETVLGMRIKDKELDSPILAVGTEDNTRNAILLGENIWKWRLHAYRNLGTFKDFDAFFGKLIRYLSINEAKNRFTLDYSPLFNQSNEAIIKATYFDEAFAFVPNASIKIAVRDTSTQKTLEMPMLLRGNNFEVDLGSLNPGTYSFTATVEKENLKKSGQFTILDFDVEKQFTASNPTKLGRLARNTGGELFFPGQIDSLALHLYGDSRFTPIQKNKLNVVPLIDFKWILGIIVLALTLEWFIRKYNGLI